MRIRAAWLLAASLAVVAALGACGQDGSEPDTAGPTDLAGTAACDRAELVVPARPEGGWIGGTLLEAYVEVSSAWTEDPALDWAAVPTSGLAVASTDTRRLTRTWCATDGGGRVEAHLEVLVVELAGGSRLEVELGQLVEPLDTVNLATEQPPVALEGGSQVVRSDLFGDGSFRTVWLVRPDGLLAKVRATGPNAPDVSGWPTTMAPLEPPGPAGEAPLALDELESIARTLLDR